ncbi:hypothetical protein CHUAL_011234 [Chamberlinius hualienensis]
MQLFLLVQFSVQSMSHFIIVFELIFVFMSSYQNHWTTADMDQACLYGWQLSENGSTCSIHCFIDKYGYINDDCNLLVFTKLKTYYNGMMLYMSPGKQLTNRSQLSYCYNVTLNSQQFSITSQGQLDLGTRFIQIGVFNLSNDKESVTFCYPLSPQLLQCTNDVTDYGNYQIINSTKLHIPSKNITAYLGDFDILSNGSAVTCNQNIDDNSGIPRCNYVTFKPEDIHLNSDGSILIIPAKFIIKNPIYSIITSNYEVQVCFPISLEMLNCDHSQEDVETYFSLSHNVYGNGNAADGFVEPVNYYLSATYTITFCNKNADDTQEFNYTKISAIDTLLEGTILLIIIGFRRQYFLQNYHCKCLLCHLITLIAFYFYDTLSLFFSSTDFIPCYLNFSFYYFIALSVVAWLSIISYDSWRNVSKLQTVNNCRYSVSCIKLKMKTRFLLYCLYAWGIPAVLLMTILTIDLTSSPLNFDNPYLPHIEKYCFFTTKFGYGVYWCLPLGLDIAIICIFMFLTIWNIRQAATGTELVNQQIHMQIFIVSVRIVVVLALTWVVSYIMTIGPLISLKIAASNACLYGWQLNENGSTCSIHCFIDKYGYINPDCNQQVLTRLKTSYKDMTLYMSPGKQLTNSSQLSYCYNVTLNRQQFSITSQGQLDLGNRFIQIGMFNLSKDKESVTFSYPLSPQLLQCTNDVTDYGNYQIINSTKLHIPSKNITAYLGDFYILSNGSAVTCVQNIKIHIDIPRCNYITVKPEGIHLNSDGSISIIPANFTIKNPAYSIITSNYEVQVCFPISLDMLNCDDSNERIRTYYDLEPNLYIYSEAYKRFVEPVNYYLSATNIRQAAAGTEMVNQQINMQIFLMSARIVVVLGLIWLISFIIIAAPLFNWKIARTSLDVSFLCGILHGYILAFIYCPKRKILDKIRDGIAKFRRFRWHPLHSGPNDNSASKSQHAHRLVVLLSDVCVLIRFNKEDLAVRQLGKDMTLYMSSGKQLTNSSQLSYCHNVTLNSQQFSITPEGQLDLGNRFIQIRIFNLSKDKESVSFCYPLSPQLLQCPNHVTDYGNYLIINSTKLHISSKNITAYLGDFYILSNGSAVTCEHNINDNTVSKTTLLKNLIPSRDRPSLH